MKNFQIYELIRHYVIHSLLLLISTALTVLSCSSSSTGVGTVSFRCGQQHTTVVSRVWGNPCNRVGGSVSVRDEICVDNVSVTSGDTDDLKVLKVAVSRVIPRSGPHYLHLTRALHSQLDVFWCT